MARPKRVLTLFHRHRRGGHVKRLYMMIDALVEQGYEVHYLSARPLRMRQHELIVPHILRMPFSRVEGFLFWLTFNLIAPFSLLLLAVRLQPICIAAFDNYFSCISKLASLISRAPIVLFMRGVPWRVSSMSIKSDLKRKFRFLIDVLGMYSASRIVAVTTTMSEEIARRLPGLRKRLQVLPNAVIFPRQLHTDASGGVPADEWTEWMNKFPERKKALLERYDLPEDCYLLSTAAELVARKNIEHLVRAIGATDNDQLALIICGDGPEKAKIMGVTVGLGLIHQVEFAGWVDNPLEVVAGSDLFVMPSKHEGMANSLLEALGAGVAVITSDTPEMREVLVYDELLCNPTHVGSLGAKLNEIASSPVMQQRIRDLSQERARAFTFHWGKSVVELLVNRNGLQS